MVWTDRMLEALEAGVKGGRWYSLMDKVDAERTLRDAFRKVKANQGAPGSDHVTVERFERHLDAEIAKLAHELRTETYEPRPVRRVWIPKPGKQEKRPLGIPAVRDRVVQTALRDVLEPIFEKEFAAQSYGFRPRKGCKDALRRVEHLLKEGRRFVVDADLKAYFDTIPHEELMERVEERVADGKMLRLIRTYLQAQVMDGMSRWTPEQGSPQGAVISPLLANIYLNALDHQTRQHGWEMVRYADDFVILCRSQEEATEALREVKNWVKTAGLELHPEKTKVVDTESESFEFLGYRFDRGRRYPRRKSIGKLREAVKANTKRANGDSLKRIIANLNPRLRGWYEYFKHSHQTVFPEIDGYVRRRLRSILRKRSGRKGGAYGGKDHQRWPNAFFEERGLFTMKRAHELALQPA